MKKLFEATGIILVGSVLASGVLMCDQVSQNRLRINALTVQAREFKNENAQLKSEIIQLASKVDKHEKLIQQYLPYVEILK